MSTPVTLRRVRVPNSADGGAPRLRRALAAIGALSVVFSLAACAGPDGAAEDGFVAERKAAMAFMEALEAGHAQEAAALISDSAGFAPGSLEEDFYALAEARPENAEIVGALQFDEKTVYVDVAFDLAGEQRDIKISFDGGDAQIAGWLGAALPIASVPAGGELVVSDSLPVPVGADPVEVQLLPGRYLIAYEGTAIDPSGGLSGSFPIEFPVVAEQVTEDLPSGIARPSASLEIGPES